MTENLKSKLILQILYIWTVRTFSIRFLTIIENNLN